LNLGPLLDSCLCPERDIQARQPGFDRRIADSHQTFDILHVPFGLKENQGKQAIIVAKTAEFAPAKVPFYRDIALLAAVRGNLKGGITGWAGIEVFFHFRSPGPCPSRTI
jgi:hypothetical protein